MLSEKVAVVTGASSGIGAAIAREFARQRARLFLVGRDPGRLAQVAGEVASLSKVTTYVHDLRATELVEDLASRCLSDHGRIEVLVNCGGLYARGDFGSTEPSTLADMMHANVTGTYALTRALLPELVNRRGDVVFVNSSIVRNTGSGTGAFAATQHALGALAESLRAEVNKFGVRVLSIFPGRTATPRQERIFADEGREYDPGQLLQPGDVATIVAACLSLPPTAEVTDLYIRPTPPPAGR